DQLALFIVDVEDVDVDAVPNLDASLAAPRQVAGHLVRRNQPLRLSAYVNEHALAINVDDDAAHDVSLLQGAERTALGHRGREFIEGNVWLGRGASLAPIAVVPPFWGGMDGRGGGGWRRGRDGGGTRRRSLVGRGRLLNRSGSRRLLGSLLTHKLRISSQQNVRRLLYHTSPPHVCT